ncbi:response regulator [Ramlibacter sp.]|uniref:response regulator n=1 Tax=Ramlibacter sp. TaxID=1917967 RepID=UPI00185159AE|nr:response regulator [Ramlibacter sp.]MBA2674256.1 response regulator [Ramlibacter sp.]
MPAASTVVFSTPNAPGRREAEWVADVLASLDEQACIEMEPIEQVGWTSVEEPQVVVLAPSLPHQLAAARAAHARWPQTHLVLIQHATDLERRRQEMGITPMLGRYWSVVESDDSAVEATLRQALKSSRQRRQLRTTLAAANVRMAQPKPVAATEYQRLITSEHHLSNFLRYSAAAVFGIDSDTRVLFWSEGTASLLDIPAARALGKTLAQLLPWAAPLLQELRELKFGTPRTVEQLVDLHGEPRAVEALLSATADNAATPMGATVVLRDVTARRKAQEQLREANLTLQDLVSARTQELEKSQQALMQAQKLEAVGKLTGGVAHDFNNVLQIIGSNLQLLQVRLAEDSDEAALLRAALQAVDRGAKLSSQLLAFARRQPLEPVPLNVSRRVAEMGDLLRRALGEDIELETVLAARLWTAVVDPNQLENVILNLAINARDAMPEGGKLTIETANTMLDDSYVSEFPDVSSGQYVMVAVSDTGSGMPPEVVARAFEPFFTTKPEGKGTGLGLSMAYGFAKQSGGHIRIYSEPGSGTSVKLYLPRSHEKELVLPHRSSGPIEGGSETILVVEDDLAVQAAVVNMLQSLGYRVVRANDAQAALTILQSGLHIDLLFTDVVMPGPLRSPELARRAKSLFPDLGVLFTSGYTQNAIVHGGKLDPGVELLSKPYRQEDLARKVRQILAQRRPAGAQAAQVTQVPRILLVEDEADLRDTTVQLLNLLGCQALAVDSAEAAQELLAREQFDLLMTDLRLPGRSGVELARDAALRYPGMRLVICSGYGAAADLPADVVAERLSKPYAFAELEALVKTLGTGR